MEMGRLITGPCLLVPIPDRNGDLTANAILAAQVASFVPGARVVKALRRTAPIQSQCERHRKAQGATPAADHHMTRANPTSSPVF
jgi:hypothetical protein